MSCENHTENELPEETPLAPHERGHNRWLSVDQLKTIAAYAAIGLGSSLVTCSVLNSMSILKPEIFNELCMISSAVITGASVAVGISESRTRRFN